MGIFDLKKKYGLSRGIAYFGNAVFVVGCLCLFLASIVGSISIDIVILFFMMKSESNGKHPFITGMMFGYMMGGFGNHERSSPWSLALSPFTTAIACCLAVTLGMPHLAIMLAAMWGIAIGITVVGAFILGVAELLDRAIERAVNLVPTPTNDRHNTVGHSSSIQMSNNLYNDHRLQTGGQMVATTPPAAPPPPQWRSSYSEPSNQQQPRPTAPPYPSSASTLYAQSAANKPGMVDGKPVNHDTMLDTFGPASGGVGVVQ